MTLAVDGRVAHRDVIANGVRLHVVEAGPEDGPLVLLLHGFPDHWYVWRRQLPALADAGFRVAAPDLRGYNRSEKPHGIPAYRLSTLAGDVKGLVEALGADSASLIGHDWGGMVAWEAARSVPEVVDRIAVLNAPHPAKFVRELTPSQALRSWYGLVVQVPRLPEALLSARGYRAIERIHRDGMILGPSAFTETDVLRFRSGMERPGALTSALNYYRAFFRDSVRRNLPAATPVVGSRLLPPVEPVEPPVLVCWGERDPALTVAQSEGLDRYARDVRVERFPDAGHWVHVDRPERVTDAIRDFLEA